MKNILAISGSLRQGSSNTQLLKLIAGWLPADIKYQLYEGLGQLPHFIPPVDDEYPETVQQLHRQLTDADAVIICTPEYAFGLPGSLKNMLDWTVATGNFVNKPVAVITASSKGDDAHANLLKTLGALSANIIEGATLLLPFIRAKMDTAGQITDPKVENDLRSVLNNLLKAIA